MNVTGTAFINHLETNSILLGGQPLSLSSNVTLTAVANQITLTQTNATNLQVGLADFGSPSTCAWANVVTDAKGRATCTSNLPPVQAVTASAPLTSSGGVTPDIALSTYATPSTCAWANITTDTYGRATCTSNPAPITTIQAGSGIYTSENAIYNNAAPLAVLDFLDSTTRALVIANANYTGNPTALSQTTAALEFCMGKSCYFASGTYYTSRTLLLAPNTKLMGTGRAFSFIYGTNSSAPVFGSTNRFVGNVMFSSLSIGGAQCSSAIDMSNITAPNQGPYASLFLELNLIGGTSHAFVAPNEFENTFQTVSFQTIGEGNGAVIYGNKDVFITSSFGPFGSTSAIGLKAEGGLQLISCNGLYYTSGKQPAKWAEFGGPSSSRTVYPRILIENCNFEDARVTSISLVQTPSYIGIYSSTFQALNGPANSLRSFIDNIDATSPDAGSGMNLDLRGNRFINLVGYNSTDNPTGSEIITRFAGAPVISYFTGGGVGANTDTYIKCQINGAGGTIAYRIYSDVMKQASVLNWPGSATDRALAAYSTTSQSAFSYIGQQQFICTTLSAGATSITLNSTPASRSTCFITANTNPTSLQRVIGDTYSNTNGVFLYIMFGDSLTTIVNNFGSATKFLLKNGTDMTPSVGEVYSFMYTSVVSPAAWRQI